MGGISEPAAPRVTIGQVASSMNVPIAPPLRRRLAERLSTSATGWLRRAAMQLCPWPGCMFGNPLEQRQQQEQQQQQQQQSALRAHGTQRQQQRHQRAARRLQMRPSPAATDGKSGLSIDLSEAPAEYRNNINRMLPPGTSTPAPAPTLPTPAPPAAASPPGSPGGAGAASSPPPGAAAPVQNASGKPAAQPEGVTLETVKQGVGP
jgi:hypothetical protein